MKAERLHCFKTDLTHKKAEQNLWDKYLPITKQFLFFKIQAKQWGETQGRWPKKSAEFLLQLLKNAESNADLKGLDVDHLVIDHIQVCQIWFFPFHVKLLMINNNHHFIYRSTVHPTCVAGHTALTVGSTLTWAAHATWRLSCLKRRMLFLKWRMMNLPRKRFPRRSWLAKRCLREGNRETAALDVHFVTEIQLVANEFFSFLFKLHVKLAAGTSIKISCLSLKGSTFSYKGRYYR